MTENRSRRALPFAAVALVTLATAATAADVNPATVPVPVDTDNPLFPASYWKAQHDEYALRARRGGDAVVMLGDSLTYLWGDPRRKTAGPSPAFQPAGMNWEATFPGVRAANFGIAGDRTQNLLWRIKNGELAGRPRVAVVLIGVNNLFQGGSPEGTADGVAAVIAAIRAGSPDTHILLLGLLPPFPDPNNPFRIAVRATNARLASIAGDHVTFLDPGSAFLNADGTFRPGLFLVPSVHLTPKGYEVLSSVVKPSVQALLAPPRRDAGRNGRPVGLDTALKGLRLSTGETRDFWQNRKTGKLLAPAGSGLSGAGPIP
jgi:lysophospholipase L1-like esterase